jgi:DNA-binding NtrC family response regulator
MRMAGRILIVDEDRQVRFVLQAALAKLGSNYEIAVACDGDEALRMLRSDGYDLLISDTRLPGLNGLQLAEAVRQLELHTTVIWITTQGCSHLREAARRLGVFQCFDKPIEVSVIREAALAGLNNKRLHETPDRGIGSQR